MNNNTNRKYIRFYTNATYIGRTSEKSPFEFSIEYIDTEGNNRKTFIKAWPPYQSEISLTRDKEYRIHLRWKQEKGLFDIIKVCNIDEKWSNWTKGELAIKTVVEHEHEGNIWWFINGTFDGIEMKGISYTKPPVDSGSAGIVFIHPLFTPVTDEEGYVTDESYLDLDSGRVLKREAGCMIRFKTKKSYMEEGEEKL